jgi:DNA-directed RNA polymerase specialized sigma24 family protein
MRAAEERGAGRFPTTHWSLVGRAGRDATLARREALGDLLQQYLPALRAHLVYSRRLAPHDAEDLLQDFVASKIIERELLGGADRELGKFRTYLLTSLDRFLVDQLRQRKAKKRTPGEGALVGLGDGAAQLQDAAPGDAFDVEWARGVIAESLRQMQAECEVSGRADVWSVFECRILGPLLHNSEPVEYDELVQRFGFQSASQASNVLITAKRMFARIVRGVIGRYASNDEIDSEVRQLHEVLRASR